MGVFTAHYQNVCDLHAGAAKFAQIKSLSDSIYSSMPFETAQGVKYSLLYCREHSHVMSDFR